MWVQKIRLKNIKSYGEGENGQGILIPLEQGINQIAGKNGAGKSTIIEAIGYAVFDAEPVRGNAQMAVHTYFLRNGCRSGEIDVWLGHQDGTYRVERDLGNGGRRWKVVREEEDFIEAEGDSEVREFLARLVGVERPERLAEVYHSLLGVKQGRFTLPFDLKPREAKNHFDPLLDVDIFRQCFDSLKAPADEIRMEANQQRTVISGLEGQLAQLADAPARLEEGLRQQATLQLLVDKCQQQLNQLTGELKRYDGLMHNFQTAKLNVGEAKGNLEQAKALLEHAAAQVAEAKQAKLVLQETSKDYEAYLQLEQQIQSLEKQRGIRDQLTKQLTGLQKEETALSRDVLAKQQEAARDKEQAALKKQEWEHRHAVLKQQRLELAAGEEAYRQLKERAELLNSQLALVVEWLNGMKALGKQAADQLVELEQNLQQVDYTLQEKLEQAKGALAQAEGEEQECRGLLERTKQDKVILEQQLARLSTGQCPLLGTQCHQFDPDKARQDLEGLHNKLKAVTEEYQEKQRQVAEAKERLNQYQTAEKEHLKKLARASQLVQSIQRNYQEVENPAGRVAAERLAQELQTGGDLPRLKGFVKDAQPEAAAARAAVEEIRHLFKALYERYRLWEPAVKEQHALEQQTNTLRVARQKELESEERALKGLELDIKNLLDRAGQAENQAATLRQALADIKSRLGQLEQQLQPYQGLDEQITNANEQKGQYSAGYTRYLQHHKTAEKLAEYQGIYEQQLQRYQQTQLALTQAEESFRQAEAAYNPEQHRELQQKVAQASKELGEASTKLTEATKVLAEQQQRVQMAAKLQQQRDREWQELVRLQVEEKILEKARSILKDAQEPVARNLTARVAAQAQSIYNTMSPEAAQFNWRAGDYVLTVTTVSGEKRFASLSGGQQMKAALAMQLALVKEFSRAGFCAFDEPTYGLDAESRIMLAEAIAKAQEECKFEQLLLVSHDQAFDDKVEHALKLDYSPVAGSRL
ncbi:AAA family ATPase [Desulforamulus ferrireducens]|uniref:Nuclease SbcCD subunit C n=1 Tax=Desulforamulus ferrireducens TaxID=1833852 RepID=A0A1S6IYY6_9FIRM|nr:SMC family ATPase [Desulforamulus ferrireducens]AQS59986.1 chromosome segregation protein SMC [Desulforamulus ferrireducens]